MKIKIYFRDKLIGYGETKDNIVQWSSPQLSSIAASYQSQGYSGDDLLKYMLEKLHSHWWCEEITQ